MDNNLLFELRNAYFLGKYSQCLNIWREGQDEAGSLTDAQLKDIGLILQKTLVMKLKGASEEDVSLL